MKTASKLLAFAFALALGGAAQAQVIIFSDDFNSNASGLNTTPVGWSVSGGTVDIIGEGTGYNYFPPGHGLYIDLDGSTGSAGLMSQGFSLMAGTTYVASFELAGNQRQAGDDTVSVNFGGASGNWTLGQSDGWTPLSLSFTPVSSGSYYLSFKNNGGDNVGALLDNVVITAVPEPESWALMLAGLGLLVASGRRRLSRMS